MDIKSLKEALAASRNACVEIDNRTFNVRLPTDAQAARYIDRYFRGGKSEDTDWAQASVRESLTGWSGLTVADLLPDAGDEALPFNAENLELLLEHRMDIVNALAVQIHGKARERRDLRDTATKNSLPASSLN